MDIRTPHFWDESALEKDARRFFEICDGCRRCFNLCPSFEFLFHQIDQREGLIEKLFPDDWNRVVDLCYYCKLCYNHCPYSPPHDYQLDFPLLMLRAKALHARKSGASLRDRLLVDTDRMGAWGSRFAAISNRLLKNRFFRSFLHLFGIHRDRRLPGFSSKTFLSWVRRKKSSEPSRVLSRKAALFYTCYVNYNDPGIGKAAVEVLERNGIEVICPDQVCCGMPYVDIGDLFSMQKKAEKNIRSLKRAVEEGYDIVAVMPSCSLMLKKEYPALLGNEEAVTVSEHTYDLCEYLMKIHREGALSLDFKTAGGRILYQVPCHLRDQNIGLKSRDLMMLIPGTEVEVIERCTGHDGTWGIKEEHFEDSMKIGARIFKQVLESEPDWVSTDCPLAGNQIAQGTGREVFHPIEILARAYRGDHSA